VFWYIDTAASRVHIGADNDKLRDHRIAIVGLGGTGSYVLDLVAKTRVEEIHLFDADAFSPHNAFRSPGAWSLEELSEHKSKVQNLADIYKKLRRKGIVAHDEFLTADNLDLLEGVDFVFLCLDRGAAKRAIVERLIQQGIAFIDVGMGIVRAPTGLQGIVRVITSTAEKRDHLPARMSFGAEEDPNDEYSTNIQVAELNSLNAAFAIIRWKRLIGFYRDAGKEHYSSYQIATGSISNEDEL
jgi:molybdopterin/thiamine biosynthesis adenylyltransferase